jgi:hypothetical protein
MFLGSTARPLSRAGSLAFICEPIVYTMWDPQHLATHGLLRGYLYFFIYIYHIDQPFCVVDNLYMKERVLASGVLVRLWTGRLRSASEKLCRLTHLVRQGASKCMWTALHVTAPVSEQRCLSAEEKFAPLFCWTFRLTSQPLVLCSKKKSARKERGSCLTMLFIRMCSGAGYEGKKRAGDGCLRQGIPDVTR